MTFRLNNFLLTALLVIGLVSNSLLPPMINKNLQASFSAVPIVVFVVYHSVPYIICVVLYRALKIQRVIIGTLIILVLIDIVSFGLCYNNHDLGVYLVLFYKPVFNLLLFIPFGIIFISFFIVFFNKVFKIR